MMNNIIKENKVKKILLTIFFLFITIIQINAQHTESKKLTGHYPGQKPPGLTPEIFAPGIISTGYHEDGGPAFSPNLSEIYFRIAQNPYPAIFYVKNENGNWSSPKTASFSGKYADGEPFISYDGMRLFFSSNRPISDYGEPKKDEDIWYVDRIGDTWSEPRNLGKPINTDQSEWSPALAANGNIYFTSSKEENQSGWKIYLSRFVEGKYETPVEFDENINSKYKPVCPCIAKDESYLIFASSIESDKRADLFITFKDDNGNWLSPKNLGVNINSFSNDLFPNLSQDNKYLFFTSWRSNMPKYSSSQKSYEEFKQLYNSPSNGWGGDIYWVDASFIEELRKEALKIDK